MSEAGRPRRIAETNAGHTEFVISSDAGEQVARAISHASYTIRQIYRPEIIR